MSGPGFGYSCAVLVAMIFALAATTKWRAPAPTRAAFEAQGIPGASIVARLVPVVEATVAAVLLVRPRAGAIGAVVVMVVFTGFLVVQILRGSVVPCACFGAARAGPVSVADLAGNGFLIIAAAGALLATRPIRPGLLDIVLVGVLVAIDVGLQALLRRRHSRRG